MPSIVLEQTAMDPDVGQRNRVQVAVGVVSDHTGRVLVNQRTHVDRYLGKWEFPGGKLEAGESVEQALRRELKEELDIEVIRSRPLITVNHDYPDRTVRLHVRRVEEFTGTVRGREGQAIQWLFPNALAEIDFLEANHPVMRAVQLPNYYLVTSLGRFGLDTTLARITDLYQCDYEFLVQIREKDMDPAALRAAVADLMSLCRPLGIRVLGNMTAAVAIDLGLDGVHLTSDLLRQTTSRPVPAGKLVSASCHNSRELRLAEQTNLDFAVLSPVLVTRSHVGAEALGWEAFASLCSGARIPLYALGGMDWSDNDRAIHAGAQGVAMLSRAWA